MTLRLNAPYLPKIPDFRTQDVVNGYKIVNIMLRLENYLTKPEKRAILGRKTGKDGDMRLPTPAQRGPFTGCKGDCPKVTALTTPELYAEIRRTGSSRYRGYERQSPQAASRVEPWNTKLYPTPEHIRGGILFISPQFDKEANQHERRKPVHL